MSESGRQSRPATKIFIWFDSRQNAVVAVAAKNEKEARALVQKQYTYARRWMTQEPHVMTARSGQIEVWHRR